MEEKRTEVFIPRGADREDPNLFVGINGVNYLPEGTQRERNGFIGGHRAGSDEAGKSEDFCAV